MLETLSERAFEEAFRCFIELLSKAALSAGAIDLSEQVSDRLNSTQPDESSLEDSPKRGGSRAETEET
jgi:hypothetical protein